jgi:hypothetical protein
MAEKLGEIETVVASDVKKEEDLWAILRLRLIDKSTEVAFKLSEDLSANDRIKITVEKV